MHLVKVGFIFGQKSSSLYTIIKEEWPDLEMNCFFLPYTLHLSSFLRRKLEHAGMLMDIISWRNLS